MKAFRNLHQTAVAVLLVVYLLPVSLAAQSGPKIVEVVSPGGLKAWLVRDSAVPVIALRFSMRGAGGAVDPVGKKGLSNMVSGLIDEGAGELDSLAFQTKLEERAISLRFSSGRDGFRGNLRTLSEYRAEAFEMMRLALTAPRFDAEPVERIRRQIITGLIRDQEDPDTVAARAWYKAAFPVHPYGLPHDGTIDSVKAITRDDLRKFTTERLNRHTLLIGVVGDIEVAELRRLLDQTFGALPAQSLAGEVPEVDPEGAGETKILRQKIPQSRVIFGGIGMARDDPDWYAAYVMNHILGGGGFGSRLYAEVREKRGLAYSVYSYFNNYDKSHLFMGGVGTANARLPETMQTIRKVVENLRESGVSAAELKDAKTYLNGSFPLNLTSSGRIAGLLVAMQRHKLGIDYIGRRANLINQVTLADLSRVAKRLLQPGKMLTVIVGDPPPLKEGG